MAEMPAFPPLSAARQGDYHICPAPTHVGGALLLPACPNLLIEGQPASKLADLAACSSSQDVIAEGAQTVLFGQLPAARITDKTVHSGVISQGASNVLIGGPKFSLPPNFQIKGPADFQQKVLRDLYYLDSLPSGRNLISRLGASGHPVVIEPGATNHQSPDNAALGQYFSLESGSTIRYNPDDTGTVFDAAGNPIASPPQIALGHELGHAAAAAEGEMAFDTSDVLGIDYGKDPAEETRNIEGIPGSTYGDYGPLPTENDIRRDAGLPERHGHRGSTRPPPSTPRLRPGCAC